MSDPAVPEPPYRAEQATPEDVEWIRELWERDRGGTNFNRAWYYYWGADTGKGRNPREHWLVVREVAFVQFLVRRDGSRSVYDLVVARRARRRGIARYLMGLVGSPVTLKTDRDNGPANALYKSLGMFLVGRTTTRDGSKGLNVYQG